MLSVPLCCCFFSVLLVANRLKPKAIPCHSSLESLLSRLSKPNFAILNINPFKSVVLNSYTSKCSAHTDLTQPFYFFEIRALWRSGLSARVPECQKIKQGGLDQLCAERFGRLIFGTIRKTGGLKGLNNVSSTEDVHFGVVNVHQHKSFCAFVGSKRLWPSYPSRSGKFVTESGENAKNVFSTHSVGSSGIFRSRVSRLESARA